MQVIPQAEETEDLARSKRVQAQHEKRNARSISTAVAESKKSSDTLVLLQLLHLHELYSPSNQGFAPPELPPVVANATGQEVAAVRCLKDIFANAPLLPGGYEEVTERLNKLSQGSDEQVVADVPCESPRFVRTGHPTDPPPLVFRLARQGAYCRPHLQARSHPRHSHRRSHAQPQPCPRVVLARRTQRFGHGARRWR